jgi:hypothetical protein
VRKLSACLRPTRKESPYTSTRSSLLSRSPINKQNR